MDENLLDTINSIQFKEVSLGYRTVTIFPSQDLDEAQIGYSIDYDGQLLSGMGEGGWLSSWLVIGNEDETGDPIFIDTEEEHFPVYSAFHGQGNWEVYKIAASLKKFDKALSFIKKISVGRENPVELEKNPITSEERKQFLKSIAQQNDHIEMSFWESWLEDL
ncbi:hypothetical protein AB5I83_18185 [Mesobacillus sp. LC4]